jgi:hypothetical protein
MNDLLVLQLIYTGAIRADEEGNVYTNGRKQPRRVWSRRVDGRKYIKLKWRKLSRTMAVGKLLWMIHNRKMVPEGMQVDHEDENCQNDRRENLRLLEHVENEARGHRKGMVTRYHPDFKMGSDSFAPWTWVWPIPF